MPRFRYSSARFKWVKMAATAVSGLQMATARSHITSAHRVFKAGAAILGSNSKGRSWGKLASACHVSLHHFQRSFSSSPIRYDKVIARAMSEASEKKSISGLPIDLKG